MAKIAVLDQNTIDQIAAGEVVERPASVVKELLENAIDAKASAVTVEIKDGGTSLIRVTDNGSGVEKDDIRLAFCRHATSKIQTAADLVTVASLGFRGEALSSIAAVSQVEFITKTSDTLMGVRYRIEGGEEKGFEEIGAPEGTTFLVRNLFFNTPVRKKFLKSNQTEGAYVADIVQKIALSHPEVSIRLIQNNQNKVHTSGNNNLKDVIYTVYGREIASNLIPVSYSSDSALRIEGFIGKPVIARGNRNMEHYFINGRYIKSSLLYKAIEEAYKPYMMQHMYPFVVLQIEVKSVLLDVNVHPTKMDVRFGNGDLMYQSVYHAINDALSKREMIPNVSMSDKKKEKMSLSSRQKTESVPEPFEVKRQQQSSSIWDEWKYKDAISDKQMQELQKLERQIAESKGNTQSKEEDKRNTQIREEYKGNTQIREEDVTYETLTNKNESKQALPMMASESANETKQAQASMKSESVNETKQALNFMASESINKAKQALATMTPETAQEEKMVQQTLFEDAMLSKPARSEHRMIGQLFDTYWLIEYRDNLYIIDQHAAHEKVLYERTMKSLKTREYTSQQISPPIILTLTPQEQVAFAANQNELAQIGFEIEPFGDSEYAVYAVPDNLFSIAKKELLLEMIGGLSQDLVLERVASMSCKAAVKGNHRMSMQEAEALVDELLELDNPYTCPHGRPTIISMSQYELEKKFKRIV